MKKKRIDQYRDCYVIGLALSRRVWAASVRNMRKYVTVSWNENGEKAFFFCGKNFLTREELNSFIRKSSRSMPQTEFDRRKDFIAVYLALRKLRKRNRANGLTVRNNKIRSAYNPFELVMQSRLADFLLARISVYRGKQLDQNCSNQKGKFMPKYTYTYKDYYGQTVTGKITAMSKDIAMIELQGMGIKVKSIEREDKPRTAQVKTAPGPSPSFAKNAIRMVSCPACGARLSSMADMCPHCGHPMFMEDSYERPESNYDYYDDTPQEPVYDYALPEKKDSMTLSSVIGGLVLSFIFTVIGVYHIADGDNGGGLWVLMGTIVYFIGWGSMMCYSLKNNKIGEVILLIFLPVIGMIICSVIRSEYEKGGKI